MIVSRTVMLLFVTAALLSIMIISETDGSIQTVESTITINDSSLTIYENQTEEVILEGTFRVTNADYWDTAGGLTATMTITEYTWASSLEPVPAQWNDVQMGNDYSFRVIMTIPGDTLAMESGTTNLFLSFENSVLGDVGSTSGDVTVTVTEVLDTGKNGDDDDDDGIIKPTEDESFPLWPIFIIVLVIGLVIAGIWVRKNIEFVREEDGSRRVMMREKDTGHILGRKKQPPAQPPEIEL